MHGRTDAGAGIRKQEIKDPSSVSLQHKAKHFSKSSAASKESTVKQGQRRRLCQWPMPTTKKSSFKKIRPRKKRKRGYLFCSPIGIRRETSSVFSLMLEITPGKWIPIPRSPKKNKNFSSFFDVATDTGGVIAELFFFCRLKFFKRQPELTRTNYSVSAVSTQKHPMEMKISGEAS